MLHIKSGDEQREKMYKRVWFEYALRVLCGVGIAGALVIWATIKHSGLRSYVEDELLTPEVIILAFIDMLSKKILTAIAGTDFVISAFVQTEMWALAMPQAEKDSHHAEVQDFDQLMSNSKAVSPA